MHILTIARAARPWTFIIMAISLVKAGVSVGEHAAIVWMFLLQAFANVANTYYDYTAGNDVASHSHDRTIVDGHATPADMRKLMTVLGSLSFAAMFYTTGWNRPPSFWLSVIAGYVVLLAYSHPVLSLKRRALGEVAVILAYGILIPKVLGDITGRSWGACLDSMPHALYSSAIMLANNIRDVHQDAKSNVKTVVVRIGLAWAIKLYCVVLLCAGLLSDFGSVALSFSVIVYAVANKRRWHLPQLTALVDLASHVAL